MNCRSILLVMCAVLLAGTRQLNAQSFENGELDGAIGINIVPYDWSWISQTDPICQCWTASSDVTGSSGPNLVHGISGNPHSGNTFVSGLHGYLNNNLYLEGLQQTVDGFTVGQTYTIGFWQTVVKQSTWQDQSGSWNVYIDGDLIETTAPTFSDLDYNDLDLPWEYREVSFVANQTEHLIQFLPFDDDDNLESNTGITGGLRMGIDLISFVSCSGPDIPLAPTIEACASNPPVLDVSIENATYTWQDGSTDATFEVTESGTYSVEVNLNGCQNEAQTTVTISPDPEVDLGSDLVLCQGQSVQLDANFQAGTYSWQDGTNGLTFEASQSGTYWLNLTLGACVSSDTVDISFLAYPEVTFAGETAFCDGENTVLTVSTTGESFTWNSGSQSEAISVTATGWYGGTALNGNCSSSDSVYVQELAAPLVDLGADASFCEGETVVLDAFFPEASYVWQDGSTSPELEVSEAGVYGVALDLNGCTATDSIALTTLALPAVDLPAEITACLGDSLLTDVTVDGGTYLWQDGSTDPWLSITEPGAFWVEVTVDGCTATDSMLVALAELAPPELGNDTTLCEGTTLVLDATQPGVNYLWQNGDTTATHTVTGMGTYWVQVEIPGCAPLTDSVEVLVQPLPVVDLGADLNVCEGDSVLLDVSTNGGSFLWQDNATSATYWVTATGTYSVEVTALGCSASDALSVDYHPLPELDLGPDLDLCEGDTWVLTAGDAEQSYLWHTGADQPSHEVTAPGLVWVVANNAYCSASDSLQVNYTALPVFGWAAEVELCINQTLVLDPQLDVAAAVVWEDGSTESVMIVDEPGLYTAVATYNDCSSEGQVWVTEVLCETVLEFPNVFTPGEDASNDVFVAITALGVEEITFEVFNRWGNLVYRSQGDQVAWDGRNLNGDALTSGTYYWVAEYFGFTGELFNASGTLTLLRD